MASLVDLVLVVDTSDSMKPCFEHLKQNLSSLISPLVQANFTVRFGLLGYAAGKDRTGSIIYDHTFIGGSGHELLKNLYSNQLSSDSYFTRDLHVLKTALSNLNPQGNEDTFLALDIASDFPFGPKNTTRRVIALFTDEKMEDGIKEHEPAAKLENLISKIYSRGIGLFYFGPHSSHLDELSSIPGCQITPVNSGDGLKNLDFSKLLEQIGKAISMSKLQSGLENTWEKAIYGQDRWDFTKSTNSSNREVVLGVGESSKLDTTEPLNNIRIKLKWTADVDLDLHAFIRRKNGNEEHVYYANKQARNIRLDNDAGIGDLGGDNKENIKITSIEDVEVIIFAANIFSLGGSFADYDGQIIIRTNNGDKVTVPLSSPKTANWCVISKLTNNSNQGPTVININKVTNDTPKIDSF